MLVLSRREGEEIQVGNNITVIVISIRGGQVRLGIKAPKNVVVNRMEIARRMGLLPTRQKKLDQRAIGEAAADPELGGEPQPKYGS